MQDTVVDNSVTVRLVRRLRERLRSATATARTTQILERARERTRFTGNTDATTETVASDETVSQTESQADNGSQTTTDEPSQTSSRSSLRNAGVYRVAGSVAAVAQSSRLYRFLTKEPESDVIVIDLRTTRSAGPVLARIEYALRRILPGTLTSGFVRLGYRLRARFLARPIRVLSIAAIAFVLVALAGIATTAEEFTPAILVLIGVLALAVRGTQSERPWAELSESRSVQLLADAFEPPEPPARADEGEPPSEASSPDDKES